MNRHKGHLVMIGLPMNNPPGSIRISVIESIPGGRQDYLVRAILVKPGDIAPDLPRLEPGQRIEITQVEQPKLGAQPKNVAELIEMLEATGSPSAMVVASDVYGEGEFPITGMVFNGDKVDLTGERDTED